MKREGWKLEGMLLGISVVFYLLWILIDGVGYCSDTPGYVNMIVGREPLYPTFLALLRLLVGEKASYLTAAILQSLLAGFAAWKLSITLQRERKGDWKVGVTTLFVQFAVVLLCRFLAGRAAVYTVEISTEGLSYSLYTLFFVYWYLYLKERDKKAFLLSLLYAVLLVCLRKQMLLTLLLAGSSALLIVGILERNWKKFLWIASFLIVALFATKLAGRVYNLAVRGEFIEHTGNTAALATLAFYCADAEDAGFFQTEPERTLFAKVIKETLEKKLHYQYSGKGFQERSNYYVNHFDQIEYETMKPILYEYLDEQGVTGEIERAQFIDHICKTFAHKTLWDNMGTAFCVVFLNGCKALVDTIAKTNPLLNWYAIFAYLGFVILWIISYTRAKKMAEVLLFTGLVLGGVLVNAGAVSVSIFAQPRYMIYHMHLFYIGGLLLLYSLWKETKGGNEA